MTQSAEATSIRHQVTVDAPIERAFMVFTEDFGTRVELEHRNLDRHLDGWQGVRDGVDSDAGWPLYLRRYADLLRS